MLDENIGVWVGEGRSREIEMVGVGRERAVVGFDSGGATVVLVVGEELDIIGRPAMDAYIDVKC